METTFQRQIVALMQATKDHHGDENSAAIQLMLDTCACPEVIGQLLREGRDVISVGDILPSESSSPDAHAHFRESTTGWVSGYLLQPALVGKLKSKTEYLVLEDIVSSEKTIACAAAKPSVFALDGYVLLCPYLDSSWSLLRYQHGYVVEAQNPFLLFPSVAKLDMVPDDASCIDKIRHLRSPQSRLRWCLQLWQMISHMEVSYPGHSILDKQVNIHCVIQGLSGLDTSKNGKIFFVAKALLVFTGQTSVERSAWSIDVVFSGMKSCQHFPLICPGVEYVMTRLALKKSPFKCSKGRLVLQVTDLSTLLDIRDHYSLIKDAKIPSKCVQPTSIHYTGIVTAIFPNAIQFDNHPQLTLWLDTFTSKRRGYTYPYFGLRCGCKVTVFNVTLVFVGNGLLVGFGCINGFTAIVLEQLSPEPISKSSEMFRPWSPICVPFNESRFSLALWTCHFHAVCSEAGFKSPSRWNPEIVKQLELPQLAESNYVMNPGDAILAACILFDQYTGGYNLLQQTSGFTIAQIDREHIQLLTGFNNFALFGYFSRCSSLRDCVVSDRVCSVRLPLFEEIVCQADTWVLVKNPSIVIEAFSAPVCIKPCNTGEINKVKLNLGLRGFISSCIGDEHGKEQNVGLARYEILERILSFKQISFRVKPEDIIIFRVTPEAEPRSKMRKREDRRNSFSDTVVSVRQCLKPQLFDIWTKLKALVNLDDTYVPSRAELQNSENVHITGIFISKSVTYSQLRRKLVSSNTNNRIKQPPRPQELCNDCEYSNVRLCIRILDYGLRDYVDVIIYPEGEELLLPIIPGEIITVYGLQRKIINGKIKLVAKGVPDYVIGHSLRGGDTKVSRRKFQSLLLLRRPSSKPGLDLRCKLIKVRLTGIHWFTMKWVDLNTGTELRPSTNHPGGPITKVKGHFLRRVGFTIDTKPISPRFVFKAAFSVSDGTLETRLSCGGFVAYVLSGMSWKCIHQWAIQTAKFGTLEWNSALNPPKIFCSVEKLERAQDHISSRHEASKKLRDAIVSNITNWHANRAVSNVDTTRVTGLFEHFKAACDQCADLEDGILPVHSSTDLSMYDQPYPAPWFDCWVRYDYSKIWKLSSKNGVLDDDAREIAWRLNLPAHFVSEIYRKQWCPSSSRNGQGTLSEDITPPSTLTPFSAGHQVVRSHKLPDLLLEAVFVKPIYAKERLAEILVN